MNGHSNSIPLHSQLLRPGAIAQWLATWAPYLCTRVQFPVMPCWTEISFKCHSPHYSCSCLSIRPYLGESDVKLSHPSIIVSCGVASRQEQFGFTELFVGSAWKYKGNKLGCSHSNLCMNGHINSFPLHSQLSWGIWAGAVHLGWIACWICMEI